MGPSPPNAGSRIFLSALMLLAIAPPRPPRPGSAREELLLGHHAAGFLEQ
jgi:hypothetical protein